MRTSPAFGSRRRQFLPLQRLDADRGSRKAMHAWSDLFESRQSAGREDDTQRSPLHVACGDDSLQSSTRCASSSPTTTATRRPGSPRSSRHARASASSRSSRPSRTQRHVELADAATAASRCTRAANGFRYINGTPSDCVHLALSGLLEQRPDLVVSGINNGANMGDDTLYSGTVAAAMEGFLFGIPAIAFSQVQKGWAHLDAAARGSRAASSSTCCASRRRRTPYLLNVNIPNRRRCRHAAAPHHPPRPPPRERAGDPPDQPARRHAVLDRPGRRRARGRPGHRLPRDRERRGLDHAAARRPDRPRDAARLAALDRAGGGDDGASGRRASFRSRSAGSRGAASPPRRWRPPRRQARR